MDRYKVRYKIRYEVRCKVTYKVTYKVRYSPYSRPKYQVPTHPTYEHHPGRYL